MARTTARERQGRAPAGWTQLRLEEPAPLPIQPAVPAAGGEFVAALIADLAAELGDAAHAAAHREEAAARWRRSGLPEAAFADLR